jgi:serine/threonine protein kinase
MADGQKPKIVGSSAGTPSKPGPPAADSADVSRVSTESVPKVTVRGRELQGVFGKYVIVKRIGKGGMGEVYLAHDPKAARDIALKIPQFPEGDAGDVIQRFNREVRVAATLNHPNICPIWEVDEVDGVPYLTMPFIQGETLDQRLKKLTKPVAERTAAQLIRKVALALAEAHRMKIIHRDLKPANIMLDHRKEPIVMDFGLARVANQADSRITKSGTVMGTPAYMPIEQVNGDDRQMGPASDVYSLGIILYELLTGDVPFDGPVMSVLGQILTKEPEPPVSRRADLSPRLNAICLKAIAKQPSDRFATMTEFAQALAEYLKDQPATIVLPGMPGRGSKDPSTIATEATASSEDLFTFVDAESSAGATKFRGRTRKNARTRKQTLPIPLLAAVGGGLVVLLAIGLWLRGGGSSKKPTERTVAPAVLVEEADNSPAITRADIPADATEYGGHWYKFYDQAVSWKEAQARCESIGGSLAIPDDAAENKFLGSLVARAAWLDSWIGVVDENNDSVWQSASGQPLAFTNWFNTNQPTKKNNLELYALMSNREFGSRANWRWCNQPEKAVPPHQPGFICEWDPAKRSPKTGANSLSTSLFNGRDLTGWTPRGAFGWRVENGVLIGEVTEQQPRGWLMSDKSFDNFELDFQYLLAADSHSGIFLKAQPDGAVTGKDFVEIQLLDDRSTAFGPLEANCRTGSIWKKVAANPAPNVPTYQWHHVRIRVENQRVTATVNGTEVVNAPNAAPSLPGRIGLQLAPKRVEFRDIRIRDIIKASTRGRDLVSEQTVQAVYGSAHLARSEKAMHGSGWPTRRAAISIGKRLPRGTCAGQAGGWHLDRRD